MDLKNSALFDKLVKDHYRPAYHFAYRITGNVADAEDLVQETFVRAYRFFSKYDPLFPFQSWLYRIMLNANVDLLRKKGKLRTTQLDRTLDGASSEASRSHSLETSPDHHVMDSTMNEPLQKGLLELSAQFRTAVLLADVEGMSYEEIAKVMHTSVGTVRSRVHRGRKHLRRLLTGDQRVSVGELSYEL